MTELESHLLHILFGTFQRPTSMIGINKGKAVDFGSSPKRDLAQASAIPKHSLEMGREMLDLTTGGTADSNLKERGTISVENDRNRFNFLIESSINPTNMLVEEHISEIGSHFVFH